MKYLYICSTFLLTLCFSAISAYAQLTDAQQAINRDVWKPFIETYQNLDAEGFMALHTRDVVRVNRDGDRMLIGEQYAQQIANSYQWMKEHDRGHSISFRFVDRLVQVDMAYEVGYYKGVSTHPTEAPRTFYGKFHVTLKRIDGTWKIYIDSDSSDEGSIGEEDFLTGKPMEG